MRVKRGLRLVSFFCVLMMLTVQLAVVDTKAATGTVITISSDGQVVDTFQGVSSLYRPGSWDGTDATYGCHAYVIRYYQAIYGKTVYNLFHKQTPLTYGDTFSQVATPAVGDICAQIKTSSNHWSIVKSVDTAKQTVTVIDQNNKWTVAGVTYAYSNYTYNWSEVAFYRLASVQAGVVQQATQEVATTAVSSPQTTEAVKVPQPVATGASTTMNVNKGAKKKITDKWVPNLSVNPAISWKSSKKSVAKVSKRGYVTGVKKGTAKVTGQLSDGQAVAIKVKVKVPTKKLKLSSTDVTIPQNNSDWNIKTVAVRTPKNATDTYKFTSSDPTIASVDANGVVTTHAKRGMTTITVTSGSKKKKCIVRVY